MDYEFTIVFDVDIRHHVSCSKDRTGVFINKTEFIISEETGRLIKSWCNQGEENLKERINRATSIQELTAIYRDHIQQHPEISAPLLERKSFLLSNLKSSQNGTFNR